MTGWHLHGEGDAAYVHRPAEGCNIAGCRPVVVLDPDSEHDAGALLDAYVKAPQAPMLEVMQAALRSLIQPPRPAEPKLLAAVVVDDRGERWVRRTVEPGRAPWEKASNGLLALWPEVAAVKVLSPGVDA